MAVNVGSLLVSLGLDSAEFKSGLTQAEKEFRRSTKRLEAIGSSMSRVGRNLTLAVTAPLAALGVASFKAASDVAEMQSAFDVSFGAMADSVREWSKTTGKELDRSRYTIQESALAFNELFSKALNPAQAAEMSKQFAVLTQDLASFKNLSDEVAQQKLFSGLTGEAEPLRAVGVFINEASVKAKALQLGLVAVNGAFTDQQKIIARAALIQEQLANAQGDVIRTADGTANQMRASAEAFKDFRVAIGNVLLALTPLIKTVTDLLNGFNNLSPATQKMIVVIGGLAAAMGPLLIVTGGIVKILAPFVTGVKLATTVVAAAGVTTTGWAVALATLRAALLTSIAALGPLALAVGAVAAAFYLWSQRGETAAEMTDRWNKRVKESTSTAEMMERRLRAAGVQVEGVGNAAQDAARGMHPFIRAMQEGINKANELAKSASVARLAMLGAERLEIQRDRRELAGRQASRSSAIRNQTRSGDAFAAGSDARNRAEESRALSALKARENQIIREMDLVIKGMKAGVDVFNDGVATATETTSAISGGGSGGSGSGPSGPSAFEIEQRFNDELAGYAQQALSSMAQTAKSADERAEYELRGVELARIRTQASIQADDEYNATQKERLRLAVEELAERERQAIELQRRLENERNAAEMADIAFQSQREQLTLASDIADTQADRKRIAFEILKLEQEYRRNMLELVLASETATDAEKQRAQAILDSLSAIEAGERASVGRQNETDVERYIRDLNKSPEQINEAIDRIKINGLESLNDALVDAVVNFKSLADVAKSVVQSILAELLRLQIQQAIIKPLAGALGLGVPGFATGTNFAPGGLAIVGERGPELVNLPRGSRVFPNGQTSEMLSRGGNSFTWNVVAQDANSFGRSSRQMQNEARRRLGA